MAINLFSTSGIMDRGQRAYEDANTDIQGIMSRRTNMQAGRAYAGGDRQGAARMLAQGGNIDGARTLENDIQGDEDRAYTRERQGMADERQAGQDEFAAAQRKVEVLTKIAQGLKGVPAGQRAASLQRALPVFEQIGIDPAMFGSLTEDQLSDEQLDMFSGEVSKSMEEYTLSPGAQRWRGDQMIADNPREERPMSVSQGATLFDPKTNKPIYTAPKTYAPARSGAGARGGGGGLSGVSTQELIAALRGAR
jgi:hypothetical protein